MNLLSLEKKGFLFTYHSCCWIWTIRAPDGTGYICEQFASIDQKGYKWIREKMLDIDQKVLDSTSEIV